MLNEADFYKELLNNLQDGVYFVDRERIITFWNKGAEHITGYNAEKVVGRACHDNILNHVTAEGIQLCGEHCPLAACMQDGQPRQVEAFLHHADGHRVPVLLRATPLPDEHGRIIGAVESFYNNESVITTRRQLQDMRLTANMDPVTGIGNRRYLEGRLRATLAEASHTRVGVGLLFIDVDHFKQFNDAYGHDIGDRVLSMVAKNLHLNLRMTDTIGRWSGDEFIVLLTEVRNKQHLRSIAMKLKRLVECSRIDLEDKSLFVTISVGGTILLRGDTPETFLHRADELMYSSKKLGRNYVTVG